MKKWIPVGLIAVVLLVCGIMFIPNKESRTVVDDMLDAFKVSITSFEEASLESEFTLDDERVYFESIELVKTEEGSNYNSTIIELSDSLLDEEMYKTTTKEGSYSKEETIALFGGIASLKKNVISDVEKEQDDDIKVVRFTVRNEVINKAFGAELSSSIDGNINIEVWMYDGAVELYILEFVTVENIVVVVRGTFIM